MTQDRMNGIIIGILFIVAAVSSVIAVTLYQSGFVRSMVYIRGRWI